MERRQEKGDEIKPVWRDREEGERERDIVERAIQWLHHNKGEPRAPAIYRPLYQTTMRGWGNFF
jgi:hypothetical protein